MTKCCDKGVFESADRHSETRKNLQERPISCPQFDSCEVTANHCHCRWCSGVVTSVDHFKCWEFSICQSCFDAVISIAVEVPTEWGR